jgi:Caspase domain
LLLTLYVDRTGDRWIFFTPSGYYYASPDAEKFVGWVIGRGPYQAPDFFSVGQFKERYRRRDVVTRVLDTLDEGEALRQLRIIPAGDVGLIAAIGGDLPPVVANVAPADNSQIAGDEAPIEYALRSPSGHEVSELAVQVDGRPVKVHIQLPILPSGQPNAEVRGRIMVPIPAGRTVTVSLIASTDTGRRSQPAWLRLRGAPAEHPLAPPDQHGRLFALIVGVRAYSHLPGKTLPSAVSDATEIANLLRAPVQRRLYSAVAVRLLTDDTISPTRAAILDGLRWLRDHATQPNDVALLFVASHGYADPHDANSFWIVPSDGDLAEMNDTAVSGALLLDELRSIAGRVAVFLDACEAGGVVAPDMDLFAADAANPWVGVFIYASSSRDQFSYEDEVSRHGNFTLALIEALRGDRVTVRDGFIQTDDIRSFVRQHFRELNRDGNKQTPVVEAPPLAPDFPLFAVVPVGNDEELKQ